MSVWDVNASNSSFSDELPPAGNHPAVLIGLIDIGTHDDEYQGRATSNRKALLCWELTAEHKSDGSAFVVAQDFNIMASLSKKAKLRGLLESWRGKPMADNEPLNLTALIGKPCLVNLVAATSAGGSAYVKMTGVSPVPKGMTVPKPQNDPFVWSAIGTEFPAPAWLPYLYGRPVAEHIGESREARGLGNGQSRPVAVPAGVVADDEDENPF